VSAEFFSLKGAKQVIKLVLKEPLAPTFCGTHSQVSLSLWNKIHKHSSLSLWKAYSTSDCFLWTCCWRLCQSCCFVCLVF